MADTGKQLAAVFRIGRWTADTNALSISAGTVTHRLEPRAFNVLRFLAERPGQLVSIDELMDALWPGVVVTPNAVTRVIAQLRKALGDDAKDPDYIETVARTGYRLLAPVEVAAAQRSNLPWLGIAAALVVLLLAAITFWPERHDSGISAVAVLPFDNFTGDPKLDYLGDGVAEEVIDSLAQLPNLKVSARSASFRYRDSGEEARDFARSLGVGYFVEGSLRQVDDEFRITAQLIDAGTGFHIWSDTSQRGAREVFQAQDELSAGLTDALARELGLPAPAHEVLAQSLPDPEAYDLFLRGRYLWHRRGAEAMQPAIDRFAEAVRIDPDFARGWAALAAAYLTFPNYSAEGGATWLQAEEAALRAQELDPDLPEVYGVLGTFAASRREWITADELFAEGVRRGEHNATAHYWYSEHLAKTGRFIESLQQLRRVQQLDPTYLAPQSDIAFAYLFFGDYERGSQLFATFWDDGTRSPTNWTGYFIARILRGDYDGARQLVDDGALPIEQAALLHRYIDVEAGSGKRSPLVEDLFDGTTPLDYRLLTWLGSRLQAYDEVLALLRVRMQHGWPIDTRPIWGPATALREQPAFIELLEEIGFVDYWDTVAWGSVCRKTAATIVCDAAEMTPELINNILGSVD